MSNKDDPQTISLLEIRNLSTSFVLPAGRIRAVDDVSFRIRSGETLGIVGESGSGKSVLARTIMNIAGSGASVEMSGSVHFEGRDVRALPRSERRHFWGPEIGMIFQDPMTALNPVKRAGNHLTEPLRYHLGLGRREAQDRAVELLQKVGISDPRRRLRQYPHEFSGGMRQRIVIAMALACAPKLLIADEPTTALDVTVQKQILDLIAALAADDGMATILISHDLGVVAGRTQRTAVMYAGRMIETAPTEELFGAVHHPYTEALLRSRPDIAAPSHTRLASISGRPPDLSRLPAGCSFAPRCEYAQDRCLVEKPATTWLRLDRSFDCHYPANTPEGEAALTVNRHAGRTAAGLDVTPRTVI